MTPDEKRLDEARRRFHKLGRDRQIILSKMEPLQAERDALLAKYETRVRELSMQIKSLMTPLYELDQERSFIARGLNMKTGRPEDYQD